jgi:hypothetical protein
MNPKQPSLVVYAATQPEYSPLPTAKYSDGVVMTEWALTAEELSALLNGGHVRLWTWTFNMPLQPLMFEIISSDGKTIREQYTGVERRVVVERRRTRMGPSGEERRFAQRRRA